MAPNVEIIRFTASEAYKADPTILDAALGALSRAPGAIQIHSGPDVQEPSSIMVVIVWESLEHHRAVAANKEAYTEVADGLEKASTKIEFVHDVTFTADPFVALAAPITELLSWDLHAATDSKQFLELQAALVDKIHELSPPVLHKGGWGVSSTDARKTFICLGWDSPQAFKEFITGTPELMAIIGQMRGLSDINIHLAKLTKYETK